MLCNSRIVDKHIEVTETAVDFVKHFANAFIVGNICLNSKGIYAVFICKLFGKAFGFFGIFRVMQRNIATAFCKSNGSLRTDSAGRTCYKYFFIILIPGRGGLSSARSCVLHTIEHIVFKFKHIIDYIKTIFNEHKFLLKRAVKEKTALCLFYFLKLSLRLTLRLNTRCSGELSLLSMQK